MAVLEVLAGELEGRRFPIKGAIFRIGRHSDNDLVLPKKYISRHHAEIRRRGKNYVVRGLSPENPIRQGERASAELILEDGAVFELGELSFRFRAVKARRRHTRASKPPPKREDAAPAKAPPDQIVWDDSDDGIDGASDEAFLKAVSDEMSVVESARPPAPPQKPKKPREKPRAPARAGGRDEASDEATDALDLMDIAETGADPFAVKTDKAAQERITRIVSLIGIGAIALAGLLILLLDRSEPAQHRVYDAVFDCGQGQVIAREVEFQSKDPPFALAASKSGPFTEPKKTAWVTIIDDDIARVDWILPRGLDRAVFLIEGKAPGETRFVLRYRLKGDTKAFPVKVEGLGPRARDRQERKAELEGLAVEEIKRRIRRLLESGGELWAERMARGSEANFARARELYDQAREALEVLKTKIRDIDTEYWAIEKRVTRKLDEARKGYKEYYDKQRALFREYTERGERRQAERQIEKIMTVIHDRQSFTYQRFKLFRDNYYR